MPSEDSLPFHRVEYVLGSRPIIESHCAFCMFFAVAVSITMIELAEAAHNCPRIRELRKQGLQSP